MVWTVTWAKSSSRTEKQFAFEIELYSPDDPRLLLIERHAVHCEKDVDILADGKSAKVNLSEVMRYLNAEKVYFLKKFIEPTVRSQIVQILGP
jgi:hypothetical protein